MNSLVVLALLAVSVSAAPGVLHQAIPAAVPLIHQVQVPVTKTVHYDVRNVVTGYSTSIIKPAIAAPALTHPFTTTLVQPALAQPAIVQQATVVAEPQQPTIVAAPAPVPVEAAPAAVEIQSDDTEVVSNPEFRSAAPAATTIVQAAPAVSNVVAPAAVAYAAAPVHHFGFQQIAAAPLALPANFQRVQLHRDTPANIVSQEQVLAPVRTHTQITPQVTQIQPEVTVRKVIHDVPVATPVVAQPFFAHHHIAAQALHF